VQGQRRAQALGRDEVGQDGRRGDVLHRAEPGQRPAQHVEQRHRRRAGERERRQRTGARHEPDLVQQQHATAVGTVRDRTAEQRHGHERHQLDRPEQPREEGGARLDVELVGQRDECGLRPEPGDDLAGDEQSKVAGGAQRRQVDDHARPGQAAEPTRP
jgi:hypothetical protein